VLVLGAAGTDRLTTGLEGTLVGAVGTTLPPYGADVESEPAQVSVVAEARAEDESGPAQASVRAGGELWKMASTTVDELTVEVTVTVVVQEVSEAAVLVAMPPAVLAEL
jgi:hypothetical protein